jgi:Trk K+ transport system NAD-binding subunit/nucleotide-binding universal stress UspA family protein
MRVILVGASRTNLQLLGRLSESWSAVVIDERDEPLHAAEAIRPVEVLRGDGSSRVVLERAGIDDADALVAATDDDDINLEVCRLAAQASVDRITALAHDAARLDDFRSAGIPAFSRDQLAARQLESEIEPLHIASQPFADGHGELVEIAVLADSPAAGRAVRDLPPGNWVMAAVLRDSALILPRGDTRILAGDRISVITSAASYGETVRIFTTGGQRFPLQYGNRVAVATDTPEDLAEASYVTRNSRARSLLVRTAGAIPAVQGVETELAEAGVDSTIADLARQSGVGLVVLPAPPESWFAGITTTRLARAARRNGVAVLFSRNRAPYRAIIAPARETADGHLAAFVAIDLARAVGANLIGVAVAGPEFLDGPGAEGEARQAARWFRESAALQGVAADVEVRGGNPVQGILDVAAESDADLIVLGASRNRAIWHVDMAAHVLRRATASVLLLPAVS